MGKEKRWQLNGTFGLRYYSIWFLEIMGMKMSIPDILVDERDLRMLDDDKLPLSSTCSFSWNLSDLEVEALEMRLFFMFSFSIKN